MQGAYDLFLALLAPKAWGGVFLPSEFAASCRDALLEAIDESYFQYEDFRYVTGQVDSDQLRRGIEELCKSLEGIEQGTRESFDMPVFRRTRNGLQLAMCSDAKERDAYFRMFEPEYGPLKGRFSSALARRIDPQDPAGALSRLGQPQDLVEAEAQRL